ncbi:MAG TPA: twin-arginine translocase subunit TatC, partial [bacterium]|nr:twin-arginine translocase subunit TatC [bacterium]
MAPQTSTPEAQDPTLFEHLFEIRTRLIRCLVVFLGASLLCYVRAADIFDFLAAPAEGHLVFTHPVGAMMAYMKLAFMAGLIISSPYIFYHAYA